MTSRAALLNSFLGHPWQANAKGPDAYDCWHLACAVSAALFGRTLPDIIMPAHPTWAWMVNAVATHPERTNWRECPPSALVTAGDGAIVLMARMSQPAHVGLWLAAERRIIHADDRRGSVCEAPLDLVAVGWRRLRYWEPLEG